MATTALSEIEKQLHAIIQSLYNLTTQLVSNTAGSAETQTAMNREITNLMGSLLEINRRAPSLDVHLPPEVMQYVQEGRNPDIYTREFVELGMRNNQRLRGKAAAFSQFRDIFANEISGGVPELAAEVRRVVPDARAEVE